MRNFRGFCGETPYFLWGRRRSSIVAAQPSFPTCFPPLRSLESIRLNLPGLDASYAQMRASSTSDESLKAFREIASKPRFSVQLVTSSVQIDQVLFVVSFFGYSLVLPHQFYFLCATTVNRGDGRDESYHCRSWAIWFSPRGIS